MNNETTKKIMNEFLYSMKAEAVLPSMRIEYEEVGYWYGLWLKITRQKPPLRIPNFPACDDDTVIFRRPDNYIKKMDTLIKTDFSGMTSEAVNVELHNHVIKPIEPKRNAVIVDFIELPLKEGVQIKTVVTIECMDDRLYEQMKDYALNLIHDA